MKRRDFLKTSLTAGLGVSLGSASLLKAAPPASEYPIAIASGNGEVAVKKALEILQNGGKVMDAVVEGVKIVEDDPEDLTVGYGGLPNEDGVVQLDAAVMYGPTHKAGAVACIEGIRNPAKVAQLVMDRTDHVLLVGKGAQEFALAHGFKTENLLTEKTRKIWLKWKEKLNPRDNWREVPDDEYSLLLDKYKDSYGTIHCSAIDTNGDIASVTTTSGRSFKIPGRVGDSPIIGAGLYADNEVGAAGSTGRGEANLNNLSCFLIVEFMRMGKSPQEACMEVCKRILSHTRLPHLLKDNGDLDFNVEFYAFNKKGEVGGAAVYESSTGFWMADAKGARKVEMAYLYKR